MDKKNIKIFSLIFLLSLFFMETETLASSNRFPYYEEGRTKYYTVRVSKVNNTTSAHTISGEVYSGPIGHGYIYYTMNGNYDLKRVNGTGSSSYWNGSGRIPTGNIYRATTTVTSKGLNNTVTDYFN